jgi:hypothetical protein
VARPLASTRERFVGRDHELHLLDDLTAAATGRLLDDIEGEATPIGLPSFDEGEQRPGATLGTAPPVALAARTAWAWTPAPGPGGTSSTLSARRVGWR